MEEESILPNNWFMEMDDDIRDLFNDWRVNIIKFKSYPILESYKWVDNTGQGWGGYPGNQLTKITTGQFKKYILNIQEPITTNHTPEDLSYLIDLFKQQQIT